MYTVKEAEAWISENKAQFEPMFNTLGPDAVPDRFYAGCWLGHVLQKIHSLSMEEIMSRAQTLNEPSSLSCIERSVAEANAAVQENGQLKDVVVLSIKVKARKGLSHSDLLEKLKERESKDAIAISVFRGLNDLMVGDKTDLKIEVVESQMAWSDV